MRCGALQRFLVLGERFSRGVLDSLSAHGGRLLRLRAFFKKGLARRGWFFGCRGGRRAGVSERADTSVRPYGGDGGRALRTERGEQGRGSQAGAWRSQGGGGWSENRGRRPLARSGRVRRGGIRRRSPGGRTRPADAGPPLRGRRGAVLADRERGTGEQENRGGGARLEPA